MIKKNFFIIICICFITCISCSSNQTIKNPQKNVAKKKEKPKELTPLEKKIKKLIAEKNATQDEKRITLLEIATWCLQKKGPIKLPLETKDKAIRKKALLVVENEKFFRERGFKILRGEDPHLYMKWIILYDIKFQPVDKWSTLEPKEGMSFIIIKTKPKRFILIR